MTSSTALALIFIGLLIFSSLVCYYAGYANGMTKALRLGLDAMPQMLNITLTERAKHLANSNPELVKLVLTEESFTRLGLSIKRSAEVKGGIGPELIGRNLSFFP
jgi:hypothetical protein